MGIRFTCPSGHKLHVKEFLAGKRGICPQCGAKFVIPAPDAVGEPASPAPPGVVGTYTAGNAANTATVHAPSLAHSVDISSPSVVIAVAESSVITEAALPIQPIQAIQPSQPAPVVSFPTTPPTTATAVEPIPLPTEVKTAPTNGVPSLVISETIRPAPPEQRYVSHRDRRRKTQFRVAIALLLAVVVLAGVLVWVLTHGPIQPAETKPAEGQPAAASPGVPSP